MIFEGSGFASPELVGPWSHSPLSALRQRQMMGPHRERSDAGRYILYREPPEEGSGFASPELVGPLHRERSGAGRYIIDMGNRRKAREYCLQILFQMEFSKQKLKDVLARFWEENPSVDEIKEFTLELVEGTLRNVTEIDSELESTSTNWKLTRMAAVDRNLLRQSAYEVLYREDIPSSVTINEAVEIAKKFGTEDSASFINGVLDKIAKLKD